MKITTKEEFQILENFKAEKEVETSKEKEVIRKFLSLGFIKNNKGKYCLNNNGIKLISNERIYY